MSHRSKAGVLVALLCARTLAAQTLTVQPHFQAGQTLQLEVKKTRQDSRATRSYTATTPVAVKVLSVDASGSVVEWTPGETEVSDPSLLENPMLKSAMDVLEGLHLEILLDPNGAFHHLRNEAEVVKQLTEATAVMGRELAKTIADEAKRRQFTGMFETIASPEVLISSATREAALYFGANGAVLELGKPVKETVEMTNPVGGGVMKGEMEMRIASLNQMLGQASIEVTHSYDPALMTQMLKELAKHAGAQVPADANVPEIRFADKATYLIDTGSGHVRSVSHMRTIEGGPGMKRVDTTSVRLVRVEQWQRGASAAGGAEEGGPADEPAGGGLGREEEAGLADVVMVAHVHVEVEAAVAVEVAGPDELAVLVEESPGPFIDRLLRAIGLENKS